MTYEDLRTISVPNQTTLIAPAHLNTQKLGELTDRINNYITPDGKPMYNASYNERDDAPVFKGILHGVIEVQPPLESEHLEDITEITLPNGELQIAA